MVRDMWHLSSEGKCATWWREECTAPLDACMDRAAELEGSLPEFRPVADGRSFRADGNRHVLFLRRAADDEEPSMEPGCMNFEY